MRRPHWIIIASAIFAMAGSAVVLTSTAAAASVPVITCVGTETQTYSPGVRNDPQEVTLTVNSIYSPCLSVGLPLITSGRTDFTDTRVRSCLTVLTPSAGQMPISWSDGSESVFSFNRNVSNANGQLVVTETGMISAGRYHGATAVRVVTGPTVDATACQSPAGLTSRTGVVSMTIAF